MEEKTLFHLSLAFNGLDKVATFFYQYPQNFMYELNPFVYLYKELGLLFLTVASFLTLFAFYYKMYPLIKSERLRKICWTLVLFIIITASMTNVIPLLFFKT